MTDNHERNAMDGIDDKVDARLEARLRSHFEGVADGMSPEGAGVDAAMTVGTRMGRRRRALSSVAAVALVVVGIGAAFFVRSALAGDPADIVALEPTGGSSAVGGAVPVQGVAAADLDWYAVDGTLGYTTSLFSASDGTLYALSTAPGVTWANAGPTLPKAIYHSEDGETWEVALLDGNEWVTKIAERGGTLYALGTAPGVAGFDAPPEYLIGTSTDAGASWETSALPTEAAPPPDMGPVNFVEVSSHLAAGPKGVLALATTRFHIDLFSLLPPELQRGNLDVQSTPDGIRAIDYSIYEQLDMQCYAEMDEAGLEYTGDNLDEMPESCRQLFTDDVPDSVVFSATWEELGFDGASLRFSELFVATDGTNFEPVPSPFGEDEQVNRVFAHDLGFVATSWGMPQLTVRISPDGRTWETAENLPALSDVLAAGTYGGSLALVGTSFEGLPVVVWSDGSGGWEQSDLSGVVAGANGWVTAAGIGEQGVVFAYQTWDELSQRSTIEVVRGVAPDNWELVPVSDIVGGGDGYVEWMVVGRDVVAARVVVSNNFGPPTAAQLVGAVEK